MKLPALLIPEVSLFANAGSLGQGGWTPTHSVTLEAGQAKPGVAG